MDCVAPFQLTDKDIRRADLLPSDIGTWCLIVNGCYHLFASEALAKKAYAKLLEGIAVR
jgi:hypothetical protein